MKLLTAMFLMFSLSTAFAAEMSKEEMMKKMQEASTPGEQHKVLEQLVGEWNHTSKFWETADGKPEESKGTSSMKMVLGGRYLQQDVKGKAMGMDFNGMGLMGFDNIKKEYQSLWVDSMSTSMMKGTGSFNASTKTFEEKGVFSCPMTESKTAEYRTEWKIVDKNTNIFSMYGKGPTGKGKEFKMMEMTYKRK